METCSGYGQPPIMCFNGLRFTKRVLVNWLVGLSVGVVVTRTLPRGMVMAEDQGAPEAGQLSRASTRGLRETKGRQRASGAKSS